MGPKLVKVSVPYPMAPALDESQREKHMAWAVAQGFPRIKQRAMTRFTMQIAAYGPSLTDTWKDINPLRPLITMSGSLQFLLEKGLKPRWGRWFHVECDPRPHKLKTLPRHKDVVYVIASCANPKLFKHIEGMHVVLFHATSGPHTKQWVAENDPGQILVGAGSTVGLTSIHVGGVFGFRHFEIHGMDGSWRGEARHAGPHYGFVHGQRPSQINSAYTTSRMMDNANFEIRALLKHFPIFCVFHGEGVVQDWVGKANLYNAARAGTPQADVVRDLDYEEISIEQASALHKAGVPLIEEAA